ncbi:MAG: RHS repeat-associated core domain-containing protein [Gemmatimonadota bacterium]
MLRFDGVDDRLESPPGSNWGLTNHFMVFAVVRLDSAPSSGSQEVVGASTISNNLGLIARRNDAGGNKLAHFGSHDGYSNAEFLLAPGTWYVLTWRVKALDFLQIRADGVYWLNDSTYANAGEAPNLAAIGARENGVSPFKGDIAEVIFYTTSLSDADMEATEDYLREKYGLVDTSQNPPTAPTGLAATAVDHQVIDLSWTDNSTDEDGFRIERREGQTGPFTVITTVGPNGTGYSNTLLTAETEYCYRVVAYNTSGDSGASNVACATTPAEPQVSDPAPGYVGWFKADAIVGLSDGDSVSTWEDAGPNNKDATQGTGGRKPIYKTGILAGKPVLRFDGADDRLVSPSGSDIWGLTNHFTVFAVVRLDPSPGSGGHDVVGSSSFANNLDLYARRNDAGGNWLAHSSSPDGTRNSDLVLSPDTWYVLTWRLKAFQHVQIRADKVYRLNDTNYGGLGTAPSPAAIGARQNGGNPFKGDIAEVIFYTGSLSDAAMETTEDYLRSKYGFVGQSQEPPEPPTGLTATAIDDGQIDLAWTDNATDENGFRVERRLGQAGAFETLIQFGADTTSHSDQTLAAETEYCYRVIAFNANGDSSPSNIACATTLATELPPDPSTVAPPIDPTVPTNVADATEFLYTGPDPIQTGVAPGTIEVRRAAVVRGRVLTMTGNPLSGVTVSILDHPELGQTLTRADGWYDMAVNGGGLLNLDFQRADRLPAQRTVDVPWQDWVVLEDVALVERDTLVTVIDFSEPVEVARGTPQTDADGTRQATLLFPQTAQATMVMPDGSTQPLSTLSVRATEYTVGENGPQAMPVELPPASAYTYAVELSVDEAEAAGAAGVEFSEPVPLYVENFLGFPVGLDVPVGRYDRAQAAWLAEPDGRIVEIVGVSGGQADIDTDGDGVADGSAAMDSLGITDDERAELASLYTAGTELWRMPLLHLSPIDGNYPWGSDGDPPNRPPNDRDRDNDPCSGAGSIIECQNQTLGERLPVVGTPFTLNYRSDRVQGRKDAFAVTIPLTSDSVSSELLRVVLTVEVAGRTFVDTFPAAPSQSTEFIWDGLDAYGREISGTVPVTVTIGHVYPFYYEVPAYQARSFGLTCTGGTTGNRLACIIPASLSSSVRQEETLELVWNGRVGNSLSQEMALGGWSLDVHHVYDPVAQVLHQGDGSRRSAKAEQTASLIRVAGVLDWSNWEFFDQEGQSALEAQLITPLGIAIGFDGSVYITDWAAVILKVTPDGLIHRVAGTVAEWGSTGDGGPAINALISPWDIDVGPDGSLYLDEGDRIRRIDPQGIITTVAGTGVTGISPDGSLATEVPINSYGFLAIGPDGSIYFSEDCSVRRIGPEGILSTAAGTGDCGFSGDGDLATSAQLLAGRLDVGQDGSLYIADETNHRIRRVGPDGIITTIAGSGAPGSQGGGFSGDGGPATDAVFDHAYGVAGTDGGLYINDWFNFRIRKVDPEGIIATIAGRGDEFGDPDFTGDIGDGGPATAAWLSFVEDIEFGPDGDLYILDQQHNIIRKMRRSLPGLSGEELLLASEDGSELYVFDPTGRHRRTLHGLTQAVLYEFSYDSLGLLTTVTDGSGNLTVIERDASGNPTAIVAPFGQRTSLTVTPDGYLASVTNPATETVGLTYHADGLLASLTDPRNKVHNFSYDPAGLLTRDDDPAGGFQTLSRTQETDAYEVTRTTALGRATTYRVEELPTGGQRRVNTSPSGLVAETIIGTDGTTTTLAPDGTITSVTVSGDPRYGMESPILEQMSVTTPGGLTSLIKGTRKAALTTLGDPLSWTSQLDSLVVNGRVFTNSYDFASRSLTSMTPEGRRFTGKIDSLGRVVQDSVPGLAAVHYSYDAFGRLSQLSQGSRTWLYTYDAAGRLQTVTDPLGRVDSFHYDVADRLTRQVLLDGRSLLFGYDAAGNPTSLTPPGRPAHGFAYTAVDLTSSYAPPDLGPGAETTTYSYNLDRQLTQIVRPDSLAIEFAYDSGGRASSVTTPNGSLSYTYDATTGNLSSVAATDALTSDMGFSYDGSFLTGVTWSSPVTGSITATYDNDFRVTSTNVNGGNTAFFGYDQDGLLTQAEALTIARDTLNGLITGTTLQSVTTTRAYNAIGEWSELRAQQSGSDLFQTTYARDGVGRITRLTEFIQGDTTVYDYEYDAAGRLIEIKTDGVMTATYDYDANGNRISFTGPGGTVTGSYDAQDRMLSYADATYEYTLNGELKRKIAGADTTEYVYDVLGNLKFVGLPDGMQIEYVVDGFNRRVGKKVNGILVQGFLYFDQLNPVAELDGAGQVVSRFIYGTRGHIPDYMVKGGVTYRLITDHLGSVRLVVDAATGTVAQRLDYDAFGRITLNTNPGFQPFGFAGGVLDQDTGLTRFGARDYDPESGRWTAKDPVGFKGQDPNLYGYVLSDPVNLIDPSGEVFWDIIDVGFFIYDLYRFLKCPSWGGAGDVGLDAFGLLPGVPSPGYRRLDDLVDAVRKRRPRRDLPARGEPNSTGVRDDGRGNGQIRDYGPDGNAIRDFDFGHDHGGVGDPHAHDWDWTRTPPRQGPRPIGPNE